MLREQLAKAGLPICEGGSGDRACELDAVNLADLVENRDRSAIAQQNALRVDSNRIVQVRPLDPHNPVRVNTLHHKLVGGALQRSVDGSAPLGARRATPHEVPCGTPT